MLQASPAALRQVPGIGPSLSRALHGSVGLQEVKAEVKRAERLGVRIVCLEDAAYPQRLKEIPDAPVCLYVLGELQPEDDTALAVVGARRCTHYGAEQAYRFGMSAAQVGLTVVSGLARGVDAQAHLGALEGRGRTLAVLGSGLGHVAAHRNAALAQRIADGHGAVLSELPLDRPPADQNFPPRNRIIAGLSLGTLVIEAARRSGALITARLACEYNREVFALPGRADSEYSAGTHHLLQANHAKLTLTIQDVLDEFTSAGAAILGNYQRRAGRLRAQAMPELSDEERRVLERLTAGGVDIEYLLDHTGLPPEKLAVILTGLQLKGLAEQLPGSRFAGVGL